MVNEQTLTQRSIYMDVIKGITIILVTIGHVIQNGGGSEFLAQQAFYENILFRLIYSFHMPLFAIVSGYFIYFSFAKRTVTESIMHQIRMYGIPLVCWTILIRFANQIIQLSYGGIVQWSEFFKSLPAAVLNDFWFLWAVLLNALILTVVHYFIPKEHQLKDVILFGIILMAIPDYMFQNHKFLYVYFASGFFANQYGWKESYAKLHKTHKILLFTVLCVLFFILLENFHRDNYIYTTGISVLMAPEWGTSMYQQVYWDMFRWMIGFIGCAVLMVAVDLIFPILQKTKCFIKLLADFGKNTLSIYCISGVAVGLSIGKLAPYFFEDGNISYLNYSFVFVASMITLFSTHYIGKILRKSILLGVFLYGRQVPPRTQYNKRLN